MDLSKNGFPRARAARLARLFVAPVVLGASLLAAAPASAAGLTGPISGWQKGTEPNWVSMYEYVPATVAANPPILVLVHYCGGNAAGVLGEAQGGGIVAAADKYGFIMVVPQTSQNCWDIATTASLTHNGGGDSGAIVDQVKYSITKHNANANRVYVTGTSSGAMMAEGLAAVYPDVFKGSSEFSGVPAGCWAVNDPAGQWSSPCAGGSVTHTAAEWGTMVKAMYPGYSGFRPRIQLWHGQADSIISFTNQTEAIKEWTNVLGLSTTPTSSTSVTISGKQYTRQQWLDSCGIALLDAWTETNGPHGTDANLNATYLIPFLALDKAGATDPQVDCMGGGGTSSGGSGGSNASGGSNSAGGSNPSGGSNSAGGSGGSSSISGASNGGSISSGGDTGLNTSAGSSNTGTGGASVNNSGGSGTTVTTAGSGVTDTPAVTPSHPGCSCELSRGSSTGAAFAWAGIVGLSMIFSRRRRGKRATNAA